MFGYFIAPGIAGLTGLDTPSVPGLIRQAGIRPRSAVSPVVPAPGRFRAHGSETGKGTQAGLMVSLARNA
ncbi:MAG: hypothetical protein OXK72_04375 [Gammaproteobacteria bacterium]|nr:hypothetical protein [Gammaproteobacteria bacterium]